MKKVLAGLILTAIIINSTSVQAFAVLLKISRKKSRLKQLAKLEDILKEI